MSRRLALLALLALPACAEQSFHTYIGDLASEHVLIAWGTTSGKGNTIGRDSTSYGEATVEVGEKKIASKRNWAVVSGLLPDHTYDWRVLLNGSAIGTGRIRTWPASARKLCFVIFGDYGNGYPEQVRLAEVMASEIQRRAASDCPVRFVLTTGDNIYGSKLLKRNSGKEDADWESKFYIPYRQVLSSLPFFPTLGNHDGNESESEGDLPVYLDNFFFPNNNPARYYSFTFAGYAAFFALDTTTNSVSGPKNPMLAAGGRQHLWLEDALRNSAAPWKIAYYHHAPFSAGPRHEPDRANLGHMMELFRTYGVKVAFNGHEHNFQFTEASQTTGGIRYVTTGAGGDLRTGNVRKAMAAESIAGWAPQRHFLIVEMEGDTLRFAPVSFEPVRVTDRDGKLVNMPVTVRTTGKLPDTAPPRPAAEGRPSPMPR